MGLFTKKEHVHFERDEAGNVIKVTRNGVEAPPEPIHKTTKQLEREYYAKHPEEKHRGLKMIGSGLKRLDKMVVNYNRTRNPVYGPRQRYDLRRGSPMHNNFNPWGDMFDMGMKSPKKPSKKSTSKKYIIKAGKAYPIAGTGKKKKGKKKRRSSSGFGFDMDSMGLLR